MANYLLLYGGGRMPEGDAEQAKVMQAWGAWFGQLGDAVVDSGNPFTRSRRRSAPAATSPTGPEARAATR